MPSFTAHFTYSKASGGFAAISLAMFTAASNSSSAGNTMSTRPMASAASPL